MSFETVDVQKGSLVLFNDGGQMICPEDAPVACVATIYEPTDISADSSIIRRFEDAYYAFSFREWLIDEIEAGRVKIFDQRYQAEQEKDLTPKQKVIEEINAMSISEADKEKLIGAFRAVLEASK
jgi:hypothetical protein